MINNKRLRPDPADFLRFRGFHYNSERCFREIIKMINDLSPENLIKVRRGGGAWLPIVRAGPPLVLSAPGKIIGFEHYAKANSLGGTFVKLAFPLITGLSL